MPAANGAALIGCTANIKASHEYYGGHWGTITAYDGHRFTISGGSIGDTIAPVFDRAEFTVPGRRIARKDTHRPAVINPSEYEYVAPEQVRGASAGDMGACEYQLQMRARIRAHMDRTGGNYSGHSHGGNCMVCGNAMATYTVLFHHVPTNTYVRMGERCAAMVDAAYSQSECKAMRRSQKEYDEYQTGRTKAKGTLEAAGLPNAWAIYDTAGAWPDDNCASQRHTVRDIVTKLVRYGSISEKQLEFIRTLLVRIAEMPAHLAARAAEHAAAADAPTGRHTFTVTIVTTKADETEFGTVLKMLVRHESGWKAWGTVPRSLHAPKGSTISLTGTFEPSKTDAKFAYFKRPIASTTEAAAATM